MCHSPRLLGLGSGLVRRAKIMSAVNPAFQSREIVGIRAAANYLGIFRSHLSPVLAGKVSGFPAIPHVHGSRHALIRRAVIDRWLLGQERVPLVRG